MYVCGLPYLLPSADPDQRVTPIQDPAALPASPNSIAAALPQLLRRRRRPPFTRFASPSPIWSPAGRHRSLRLLAHRGAPSCHRLQPPGLPKFIGLYKTSGIVLPQVAVMLRSFPQARRLLRRMGFEKEDAYFWKQMGKAMVCTYTLFGVAWLWNETSPLGWWTLKPRPKEEREMAHLYERRKFPYPGDGEAVEEFIKSGGALGTTIGPKGFADANMDSDNMQKQLQSKKFEQEAKKLWFRMRNEVIQELQEKGFDVE